MSYGLILVPIIAAIAGWMAPGLACKLIFHPVNPIQFAGIKMQGFVPAKKHELAGALGKLLSKELALLSQQIEQKITDAANFRKIMPVVEEHIDQFLRVRLVEKMPMIGMLIGEKTILEMKAIFTEELETLFPVIMKTYLSSLQTGTDMEALITHKIDEIPVTRLETGFYTALSKQSRQLALIGGICGLLIGMVQVFILLLL